MGMPVSFSIYSKEDRAIGAVILMFRVT